MAIPRAYCCLFLSFLLLVSMSSCETEIEVEISEPTINSFSLRSLDGKAEQVCSIQGDTIKALFSECDNSFCIPTIGGDFDYIESNGERVISGETIVDFNIACKFDCVKGAGEKAKIHSYTAIVKTQNGIPRIDIVTVGGQKLRVKRIMLKPHYQWEMIPNTASIKES